MIRQWSLPFVPCNHLATWPHWGPNDNRVLVWVYWDIHGCIHSGMAVDDEGAANSASLYGYQRNAPAA